MATDTNIKVGLINASETLLRDKNHGAILQQVIAALNIQVHEHFSPVWGVNADICLVDNIPFDDQYGVPNLTGCSDWWWLVLADTSDVASQFGYHATTTEDKPLGIVFVQTAMDHNVAWTVTASHELLEMLADPWLDRNFARGNDIYACDICDPCQQDSYWIPLDNTNGVKVSDFVYPAWFGNSSKEANQANRYDYLEMITQPFHLRPGGYISIFNGQKWDQQLAGGTSPAPYNFNAEVGSRRMRRIVPPPQRERSGHRGPPPRPPTVPWING